MVMAYPPPAGRAAVAAVVPPASAFRVEHSPTALLAWRALLLAMLTVWLIQRARVDAALERGWAAARASPWVQHDSFEPVLATLSFGLWINLWRIVDLFVPYLHRWKIGSGGPDGPPPLELHGQGRLEFMLRPGISNVAALAYLLPLLAFDSLYPRRSLPAACPTSAQLGAAVASSLFLYDFLFYWIHLALHRVPWLFVHVHATHHRQAALQSREVIRHSLLDGALQVGANIASLKLLGLHPLSRALHNVAVTYWLTETHSGYDMPWMLHNLVPGGVLGGSPRHEAHHKCGRVHYHQFFTWIDRALGFECAEGGPDGDGTKRR